MQAIKNAIKKLLRHLAGDVPASRVAPSLPLRVLEIDLLLDVGANVGQSAIRARRDGFDRAIVSFEPLPGAHATLAKNASADSLWVVHERCAVGAAPGTAHINVAADSTSSSLLPMLASHAHAVPNSVYVDTEAIQVITLDSVFREYCKPGRRTFLKIDTQGFEKNVLDGARETLRHVVGVQVSMPVVPLYESQPLFDEFFAFFERHEFKLWSLDPALVERHTGQLLQFDATFVRSASGPGML